MNNADPVKSSPLSSPVRFYERGRILYTAILATILLLWFVFTWPHFRPALNLRDLGAFAVLGLLANLCYCAAYLADIAMRQLLPQHRLAPLSPDSLAARNALRHRLRKLLDRRRNLSRRQI